MTCEELFGLLHDFASGELITERCETIKLHISGCERCDILVKSYVTTKYVARVLPKCPISAACMERLKKCIEPHFTGERA